MIKLKAVSYCVADKETGKEKYILTFVVETLESDLDVENIWKNVQQV